jgi:gluconolactonase
MNSAGANPEAGGAIETGGGTAAGGSSPTGGAPSAMNAEGGTSPSAGGMMTTGGSAPGPSGGVGGSAGVAQDVRPRCPSGPFPMPMVLSTKTVCADFQFNNTFNEGPTWIQSQKAFFFSNYNSHVGTGGDIIKYTPGGQCEIFIAGIGCNGLAAAPDGTMIATCHQSRSVLRINPATKERTTVMDSYMGMMLDSPNDVVVHSNGTIYFTNPAYELGGRPPGIGLATFRIDPTGKPSLINQGMCNGIGLSPDEQKLYVLLAGVWDLDAAGVPTKRADLFTGGDGMAVDCAGNLYVFGTIYTAQGDRLGSYGAGTNLAFGGEDGKTVIVAGPGTVVRELQMNLPGRP